MKPRILLIACLVLLFSAVLISFVPQPEPIPRKMTLQTALDAGWVEADIKGMGGHKGNCVLATFTNTQPSPIELVVEPGRRLQTVNENLQDILITKEQPLILAGNQTGTVELFGFCTQVWNDSPTNGSEFTTGYMTQEADLELAKFLSKNKFPLGSSQSAVWTVANDADITGIHFAERDSIEDLLQFVANLKGVDVPNYTMEYAESEMEVFTGIPTIFHAKVEGRFNDNTNVHVVLYNPRGETIRRNWVAFESSPEVQKKAVDMDIAALPKGKYTLKAWDTSHNKIEEYTVQI